MDKDTVTQRNSVLQQRKKFIVCPNRRDVIIETAGTITLEGECHIETPNYKIQGSSDFTSLVRHAFMVTNVLRDVAEDAEEAAPKDIQKLQKVVQIDESELEDTIIDTTTVDETNAYEIICYTAVVIIIIAFIIYTVIRKTTFNILMKGAAPEPAVPAVPEDFDLGEFFRNININELNN